MSEEMAEQTGQPMGPAVNAQASQTAGPVQAQQTAAATSSGTVVAESGTNSAQNRLLDIELDVSLRFGKRELPLREVLALLPGDVIELDRNVNEPADLVVGDKIVARGEVVLVDGNFGMRITEVATPQLRLESIRCIF